MNDEHMFEAFVIYIRYLNGLVCMRMKRCIGREKGHNGCSAHAMSSDTAQGIMYSAGIKDEEMYHYVESGMNIPIGQTKPFEVYFEFPEAVKRFDELFQLSNKYNSEKARRCAEQLKYEITQYNDAMKPDTRLLAVKPIKMQQEGTQA